MRFAEKAMSIFMSVVLAAGLCPLPALAQTGDSPSNGTSFAAASAALTAQDDGEILIADDADPVVGIWLKSAGDHTLLEGVDGTYEGGVFHYGTPAFLEGDELGVGRASGSYKVYRYDEIRSIFVYENDENDIISPAEVTCDFGDVVVYGPGTYFVKLAYSGVTCDFTVVITPNPVKSISFSRTGAIQFVDELEEYGDWETSADGTKRYFEYHFDFKTDDQLQVTSNDAAAPVSYAYDENVRAFTFDGDVISVDSIDVDMDQSADSPWAVGQHKVTLRYQGRTCEVDVWVVVNPVAKIELVPVTPYVFVEETGGAWETDEQGIRYYAYDPPSFAEGDRLIVTGVDGSVSPYAFTYDGTLGAVFAFNGKTIDADDVYLALDETGGHWGIGAHQMTVSYNGRSCKVGISVIASPIKSISFKPVVSSYRYLFEDENYGDWVDNDSGDGFYFAYSAPSFIEGDVLTVVASNGASTVYTYKYDSKLDDDAFVAKNGNVISYEDVTFSSDQSETNVWGIGTHQFSVNYMGRSCKVNVKVMEPASLSKAKVTFAKKKYSYAGKKITPEPVVELNGETLTKGVDYEVAYKNNLKVGKATATVSGTGAFTGKATANFTIEAANIKGAKLVLAKSSLVYNGKVRKPTVETVGGKKLKAGTDYTVKYSNAKSSKLGRYKVWVMGKGNYTGTSAKATYSIGLANPVKLKAKSPTVKLAKVATGNQTVKASAAFSVKGNKGGKVSYVKVSGDRAVSVSKTGKVTIAQGTLKGTHSVKVTATAAAKGKYAEASKTLTLKVKVK